MESRTTNKKALGLQSEGPNKNNINEVDFTCDDYRHHAGNRTMTTLQTVCLRLMALGALWMGVMAAVAVDALGRAQ